MNGPREGDPVVCYDCGNAPDSDFPRLVYAERAGGLTIVHADFEHPDLPDGWDTCYECERAAPLTRLLAAEVVVTRKDGTQKVVGSAHVCLGTCLDAHPGASVMDEGSVSIAHPLFNHRHPRTPKAPERDDQEDVEARVTADQARCDAVPTDGAGLDLASIGRLWGTKDSTTRAVVGRLVKASALRFAEVPTAAGGAPKKVYWRVDR